LLINVTPDRSTQPRGLRSAAQPGGAVSVDAAGVSVGQRRGVGLVVEKADQRLVAAGAVQHFVLGRLARNGRRTVRPGHPARTGRPPRLLG
jgi:hypothetical protein